MGCGGNEAETNKAGGVDCLHAWDEARIVSTVSRLSKAAAIDDGGKTRLFAHSVGKGGSGQFCLSAKASAIGSSRVEAAKVLLAINIQIEPSCEAGILQTRLVDEVLKVEVVPVVNLLLKLTR